MSLITISGTFPLCDDAAMLKFVSSMSCDMSFIFTLSLKLIQQVGKLKRYKIQFSQLETFSPHDVSPLYIVSPFSFLQKIHSGRHEARGSTKV